MTKTAIRAVVTVMAVALVGLVAVQVYWIQNAYTLRQQRFNEAVSEALTGTAQRYDRMITARRMALTTDVHGRRQEIMRELDSINQALCCGPGSPDAVVAPEPVEIEVKEEYLEDSAGTWVLRSNSRSFRTMPEASGQFNWPLLGPGNDGKRSEYMDSLNRVRAESRVWLERRAELVDEIFQELVSVDLFREADGIDTVALDSILKLELVQNGVGALPAFAVTDPFNSIIVKGGKEAEEDSLLKANYRVNLSRGNMFTEPRFLAVHFPDEKQYVIGTMLALLAISGVLIVTVVVAFGFTVSTIIRQKKLSDIKNDFINNMTHELKTPVSTISLACEAMTDPDLRNTPGMVDSYLKVIADENKRLGMVVENVLRTAIIDKGELKLKQEEIDLHALIATVARNMEIQASGKGGAIETDLTASTSLVRGDSVHLTNVIFNLIDNALKYTRDTPLVRISTTDAEPGHICIAVQDNGIGMAKDQLQRIFDQFYRVPTGNVHDVKGFGLGLSYVKAIVEKHGGHVNVMSEPGRGSRFEIELPLLSQPKEQTDDNFQ